MNILKSYGNDKTVVILTKPCGYRKKAPGAATRLITKIKYGRYPELVHTMNMRYKMYNREQEEIEARQRPDQVDPGNAEDAAIYADRVGDQHDHLFGLTG